MNHFTLKGSHYEMGVQRGRSFQQAGLAFPLHLDSFQLAHGKKSGQLLKEYYPEVCREIRGVCDTIGADYETFTSWLLCMGCCMYNLEQNIPVEIRGCTAFAYEKDGRVIYGRNNDLPPYLRDHCSTELYMPDEGARFLMTTSSFINGEEGINEHGLAVAMTFVMTSPEQIQPGFNSCFVVRYLLEKAASAEHALALLMGLPVSSGCNILVADRSGRMAVAECTPKEKRIREALHLGEGKIVCAVNGFTSPEMMPYDMAGGDSCHSAERYQVVLDSFSSHFKGDLIDATEKLLRGDYGFMCQYDDDPNFETVWSSIFDLKSLMICRAEGDPRKYAFAEDPRLRELRAADT